MLHLDHLAHPDLLAPLDHLVHLEKTPQNPLDLAQLAHLAMLATKAQMALLDSLVFPDHVDHLDNLELAITVHHQRQALALNLVVIWKDVSRRLRSPNFIDFIFCFIFVT